MIYLSRLLVATILLVSTILGIMSPTTVLTNVSAQEPQNRESIYFLTDSESLYVQGNIKLWEYNPLDNTVEIRAQRSTVTTSLADSGIPPEELALIVEHGFATKEDMSKINDRPALHLIDKLSLSPDREHLLFVERIGTCFDRGQQCYGVYKLWFDDFDDDVIAPQETLVEIPIHPLSGWFSCEEARGKELGTVRISSVEWSPTGEDILLGITCGSALDVFPLYHVINVLDHSVTEIGRSQYMTWASNSDELAKVSNTSCTDAEYSASTCFMEFQIIGLDDPETPLYTVKAENFWFFDNVMQQIPNTDSIGILGRNTSQDSNELRIYHQDNAFQTYDVPSLEKQFVKTIWTNNIEYPLMAGVGLSVDGMGIIVYDTSFEELISFEVETTLTQIAWGSGSNVFWGCCNDSGELIFFDVPNQQTKTVDLAEFVGRDSDEQFIEIIAIAY